MTSCPPSTLRSTALALAAVALLACASNEKHGAGESVRMLSAPAGVVAEGDFAAVDPASRVIVRSGSIRVVVDDPSGVAVELTARIEQLGGFVVDSNETDETVFLSVRVPSDRLEPFLDEVAAHGEEESRSIGGRDVTDEYADVGAELENLTALRDRLRALLDRANEVEEILEVERELTRVQTRIDVLSGRKQRIERDVALSPVSIELVERPPRRILGPLGLVYEGLRWFAVKLFVISP